MALPPAIVLPVSYFILKEKYGWQALRFYSWSDRIFADE
jgi:hypothetical protein